MSIRYAAILSLQVSKERSLCFIESQIMLKLTSVKIPVRFNVSYKEVIMNDTTLYFRHLSEFSNVHENQRSLSATASNLLHKITNNFYLIQTLFRMVKGSLEAISIK